MHPVKPSFSTADWILNIFSMWTKKTEMLKEYKKEHVQIHKSELSEQSFALNAKYRIFCPNESWLAVLYADVPSWQQVLMLHV